LVLAHGDITQNSWACCIELVEVERAVYAKWYTNTSRSEKSPILFMTIALTAALLAEDFEYQKLIKRYETSPTPSQAKKN